MPVYKITPQDVLFFRDARPMSGSSSGHGARWPEPNILFAALHAALHRAYPGEMSGEHKHRDSRYRDEAHRDKRFGSLQTAGPFPVQGAEWFFPRPQDVVAGGMLLPLTADSGSSKLPQPLKYSLASNAAPSKEEVDPWWDKAAIEAYLTDKKAGVRKKAKEIFAAEWATGIGIDPETQTQDGTHIYSSESLRLQKDVHMGLFATLPLKNETGDGLDRLFAEPNTIVVGGQQRVCHVEKESVALDRVLPIGPAIQGERMKWVLLSPALFPRIHANLEKAIREHPGGWLPSWVDPETGKVMLKDGPGENKVRRKGGTPGEDLDVHLVAARIPKPIPISGWSERLHLGEEHGATPTVLAVPAGAVYFFEGPDAPKLANLLNWQGKGPDQIANRRSAVWGEKGFGIGVCGVWEPFQ